MRSGAWFNDAMTLRTFAAVAKAKAGDRVAILSPSFAVPRVQREHESAQRPLEPRGAQLLRRLDTAASRTWPAPRWGAPLADRMPGVTDLAGAILLLETSEEVPAADEVKRWVRALGERGILDSVAGVPVARPPVSQLYSAVPSTDERARLRGVQREVIIEQVARYNPDAVICVGVPFASTVHPLRSAPTAVDADSRQAQRCERNDPSAALGWEPVRSAPLVRGSACGHPPIPIGIYA
jgi:hypothetical protein